MKRINIKILVLGLAFGCQTQFVGDPHISPAACQQRCASQNMQMTGMVYMGEYSSACICEVPRAQPAAPSGAGAAGAAAGAAAGVVMQQRRNDCHAQGNC